MKAPSAPICVVPSFILACHSFRNCSLGPAAYFAHVVAYGVHAFAHCCGVGAGLPLRWLRRLRLRLKS